VHVCAFRALSSQRNGIALEARGRHARVGDWH
jgi:hypothetical protein